MGITVGSESGAHRKSLTVGGESYAYYDLSGAGDVSRLPKSLKVVLENMLRNLDGATVTADDVAAFAQWAANGGKVSREIAYRPARVLMQDFTGVPAVVDLAAMRDAMVSLGGDPKKINPLSPVDLVIDHSVMVDEFGNPRAFQMNVAREYERNGERYTFLKWGQGAFENFRVVPPGTGICHQVNLEYLAQTVWTDVDQSGAKVAYPDTLVGTDSHTTMVNGMAVLGWGVGGIEAEAAMLGQPISMLIPEVVGFELTGALREGVTATDLVLRVVELLRQRGVVGKFVEFYGSGLDGLPLADRATIANMAPEYGATCGFFPIDDETLRYLRVSGRDENRIALVEAYAKANGFWREGTEDMIFSDTLALDMSTVESSISGPKRPQDRISLSDAKPSFERFIGDVRGVDLSAEAKDMLDEGPAPDPKPHTVGVAVEGAPYTLRDGHVVIAAITSCTNTSNPYVMIGAGLVAKKAAAVGLETKPWVKTSLAPGSQVVSAYLEAAGLQDELDKLGFNVVGYGCTTCIGNSGPLPEPIANAVDAGDLVVCSVLSGNRNFEGRVHPQVRANYLASPPLVVAYALAGDMTIDVTTAPLGQDRDGKDVFLRDIWPSQTEIAQLVEQTVTRESFQEKYADVFAGDAQWKDIEAGAGLTYDWSATSTYVQNPPYFEGMSAEPDDAIADVESAKVLMVLGDSITTDHISPAGSIKADSPAGSYLQERQIPPREFNSYGARRGNHQIMMRGTFANIRIRNEMLDNVEGGYTRLPGTDEQMSVYDAAMRLQDEGRPLVIVAGSLYGNGSSRDWAAKGTKLLGVKAVIAESFERIHRSNLVGMGVLPFEFTGGDTRKSLGLTGDETISIRGLAEVGPRDLVKAEIVSADGAVRTIELLCRIDTETEIDYVKHGGVLSYVLRDLAGLRTTAA